jgi:hypothetical protein
MLGAWNVRTALGDAFIGLAEPGPITLRWQLPGGTLQSRDLTLEDRLLRVVLEPQATK